MGFKAPFIILALIATQSFAQDISSPRRPNELSLTQQGQLFTVSLSPQGKQMAISIAGNQVAEIDPEGARVMGRMIVGKNKSQALRIVKVNGQYRILDDVRDRPLEIEVQDPESKKSETFRFSARPGDMP